MCGIAGIIDFRQRHVEPATLNRLEQALAHRGPDGAGSFQADAGNARIAWSHTRLAVIDPQAGVQPMLDATGRWVIVYNGELYNYRGLREQLPGSYRTQCDTEVVLHACMHWGTRALQHFDGMWAMAVIDTETGNGHLSRDPFGIKPLVYTIQDDQLVFASELRALRQVPGLVFERDPVAVHLYLHLGYIPHPWTIYKGVHKLPPGHLLAFDAHGPRPPERFYQLPTASGSPPAYDDACRQLRTCVESVVQRQMVADVPLGSFLSGGLDSAVVTACLQRAAGRPIKTFSIGYPQHPRYDESGFAQRLARHLGTEHHGFQTSFADVLAVIEPMLNHLGEPFADSSLLPTALVSQLTRTHVTVALSGDGGDELFAGYWRYLGHDYLERYRRLPGWVRRGMIEPLLRHLPTARSTPGLDRLRQARKLCRGADAPAMTNHLAWSSILESSLAGSLLGPDVARQTHARLLELYQEAAAGLCADIDRKNGMEEILLADLGFTLPGDMLFKVDTASMYHGLEVRVPLVSTDLAELVTHWPLHYRLDGRRTKRILRDAFADLLPAETLQRRKMGFEVPIGEFLRRELHDEYRDCVTPAALRELGITPTAADNVFAEHLARRADHTELLWALFVLCRWHHGEARGLTCGG